MTGEKWALCIIDNSITFGSVSEFSYLPPVDIDATPVALLAFITTVLPEETVTMDDIDMVACVDTAPASEGRVVMVALRGAAFAKIYTGDARLKLWNDQELPHVYDTCNDEAALQAMRYAHQLIEEHGTVQIAGQEWFQALADYAANNQDPELFMIIDSIPADFRKVGDTHVIVPNADNVTDDMLEASRNLLLYTDTFGTIDSEYVRKAITRRKWTRENMPEWFADYRGHLTKDARASLAYALTISAYTNPPKPAEKYFPEVNAREIRFVPSAYGCKLSLEHGGKILDITREFESWRDRVSHGTLFDVQINRHQLPEYWRKLFKKNAIEIGGVIMKDNTDGEISLENAHVNLGLKNEYAGSVPHTFEKSIKIPKGRR